MRISDFDLYQELLMKHSGLDLTPDKSYLLDSRLTPVAKKWGYDTLDAMTIAMRGVPEPKMVKDVIEAMTTNETSFFRDGRPFDLLKDKVLPILSQVRPARHKLTMWCAASSSGQEPYSLAMTFAENKHLVPNWTLDILATDISDEILEKARSGEYTQFEAQRGLPVQLLLKYFEQAEDKWKVNNDIRKMIRFENFNLLNDMGALGSFDIILCRNVLIYFDEKTKARVLESMAERMPQDGFLFLGGAETVLGITEAFKPMPKCHGLYVRADSNLLEAEQAQAAAQS